MVRTDKTQDLRILISNDDGVNAHGIKVLESIAHTLTDDVWVVAPESEQSGAAHSLTLRRPLRIHKISPRRFAVDGTPTDCVMVALLKIFENDKKPTLMLSGINHGANMGEDVTYSGTVAAAMEATLLGVPSIALSQVTKTGQNVKWATAEHYAPLVIKDLLAKGWPQNVLMNINFPNLVTGSVKGVKYVSQGLRNIRDTLIEWVDPRGNPYYWIGAAERDDSPTEVETDLEAIQNGYIAVTPLHLNLTHAPTLEKIQAVNQEVSFDEMLPVNQETFFEKMRKEA
ncbi:MAG: 5'/3'-nucleotidase SurE [Alphaproteobacteria bacterium]|jgi:5'-nucleotidase|nr:5'/3'-nucleotidase SurE [Alphaproteobacteria bacterium]